MEAGIVQVPLARIRSVTESRRVTRITKKERTRRMSSLATTWVTCLQWKRQLQLEIGPLLGTTRSLQMTRARRFPVQAAMRIELGQARHSQQVAVVLGQRRGQGTSVQTLARPRRWQVEPMRYGAPQFRRVATSRLQMRRRWPAGLMQYGAHLLLRIAPLREVRLEPIGPLGQRQQMPHPGLMRYGAPPQRPPATSRAVHLHPICILGQPQTLLVMSLLVARHFQVQMGMKPSQQALAPCFQVVPAVGQR
mmetsp:Transcript_6664/g.16308  ORF Transcript_6664/g.16308 Transcript_6664/m.16308 type:complete len:250 (-) Transcript_6664:357-1106(-)